MYDARPAESEADTQLGEHPPNVIFLDIDGVLQPGNCQDRFNHDLPELRERLATEWDEGYRGLNEYDIGATCCV